MRSAHARAQGPLASRALTTHLRAPGAVNGYFAKQLIEEEFARFDVEIHGYPGNAGAPELATARAEAVKEMLVQSGVDRARLFALADKEFEGAGDHVDFLVRQYVLPGEHGFRFFPAFYRHVFDTMKRTPLLAAVPRTPMRIADVTAFADQAGASREPGDVRNLDADYVETGRTAFDQLVATTSQALAFNDGIADVDVIPRRRIQSVEVLRSALRMFLSKMGFTLDDMSKLSLKLAKYMTSSSSRRKEQYEKQSWWDFIEGDALTVEGQARMDAWPRALVAMSSREADARTQGNVIVQLLLDQIVERDYTDGTLSGSTTDAWLTPWRTFLEQSQGVKFLRGKLTGFHIDDDEVGVVADTDPFLELGVGTWVVATSLLEAKQIATNIAGLRDPRAVNSATVMALKKFDAETPTTASPKGSLKHLVGIQFYFSEDVQWVNGHIYFPDSEWELTAISQAKFWKRQDNFRDGYYGTLSVCIGNLGAEAGEDSPVRRKCAWDLGKDDIAKETWRQISAALSGKVVAHQGEFLMPRGGLPEPIAYHLDDNLVGEPGSRTNLSPLLVNKPGLWDRRPGFVEQPENAIPVYEVVLDRIVFAGTYMQTLTRLTTMEAANESGRHAANTILLAGDRIQEVAARRGNLCPVWDPEDNELEDLGFLKEIDQKLMDRGLPHFLDIVSIDMTGVNWIYESIGFPLAKTEVLDAIGVIRRLLFR